MATMVRRTEYRVPDATPERVDEVLRNALAPLQARPGFLLRLAHGSDDAILAEGVPEKCWVGETLPWGAGGGGFCGCYVRRHSGGVHLLLTYSIEVVGGDRSVMVELKWERQGAAVTLVSAWALRLDSDAWEVELEDTLHKAGLAPQKVLES